MTQRSQTKSLFDRLSKRDREEVLRIDAIFASWASSPQAYAAKSLSDFCNQRGKLVGRGLNQVLAGMLHQLRGYFSDYGIIRRFLDDDVQQLGMCVDTSARLGLLMTVAGGPEYSGGYDCLHVFDLLSALAVDDRPLVEKFLIRFPGPSRSGHPTTVLLANGVYAVLRDDQASFAAIEQRLRNRNDSDFFRAIFDCLLAIMAYDAERVSAAIGELRKGNRRRQEITSMEKLICLPAHGLYHLSLRVFAARGLAAPRPPVDSTWDGAFHAWAQSCPPESRIQFFDFAQANPVLTRWMAELPGTLNVNDLLAGAQ